MAAIMMDPTTVKGVPIIVYHAKKLLVNVLSVPIVIS
jgi:hypothetical protein